MLRPPAALDLACQDTLNTAYSFYLVGMTKEDIRIITITLLTASIMISCNHHKIVLNQVSDLPEYFFESKHFGRNIKSIEELMSF